MYRVYALSFISVSSAFILCRGNIKRCYTLLILQQTLSLLQTIGRDIPAGKTYPEIFYGFNKGVFSGFGIERREEFCSQLRNKPWLYKPVADDICSLIFNLGKCSKYEETMYIRQQTDYFRSKYKDLQDKHNKRKKPEIICGISIGMIIFIVLI